MLVVVYARTSVVEIVIFMSFPALAASSTKNQYGLDGAVAVLGLPDPPAGLVPKLGVEAKSRYAQKYVTYSPVEISAVVARNLQSVAPEPQEPTEVAFTAV